MWMPADNDDQRAFSRCECPLPEANQNAESGRRQTGRAGEERAARVHGRGSFAIPTSVGNWSDGIRHVARTDWFGFDQIGVFERLSGIGAHAAARTDGASASLARRGARRGIGT